MNYSKLSDYYKSPLWANKRNERLKIDGFKCAKCGFTRALEVHHINYERIFHEDVSKDLITLCKKCHNEIEAQKKDTNPIQKPVEHHSVYLAGKISRNDWRYKFCNYRGILNAEEIRDCIPVTVNESLTITGPFFISCDHGCYHGEGRHGVGADHGGCGGYDTCFTRDDVLNICRSQILAADVVFAYIDCRDCYRTLAEIGFAYSVKRNVIIVFDTPELKEEMWFIDKMQHRAGDVSDEWIEKHLLSKFKEVNK